MNNYKFIIKNLFVCLLQLDLDLHLSDSDSDVEVIEKPDEKTSEGTNVSFSKLTNISMKNKIQNFKRYLRSW